MLSRFCWGQDHLSAFFQVKVTAPIRIGIRRRIIRVAVREPVVRPIIPIATEADRPNNVGIDEVRSAPSIPTIYKLLFRILFFESCHNIQNKIEQGARPLHPLTGGSKGHRPKSHRHSKAQKTRSSTRARRTTHDTKSRRSGQTEQRWN